MSTLGDGTYAGSTLGVGTVLGLTLGVAYRGWSGVGRGARIVGNWCLGWTVAGGACCRGGETGKAWVAVLLVPLLVAAEGMVLGTAESKIATSWRNAASWVSPMVLKGDAGAGCRSA